MFSDNLKRIRKDAGVTQKELAENLFVSQQAVARWETNRATPNPEAISKIADYFGVSTDYLLGNNTKKEPPTVSNGTPSSEISRLVNQLSEEQQRYLLAQIKGLLAEQE